MSIEPDKFLSAVDHGGLGELTGNPLSLRLLAEVWLKDAGLPESKTALLHRATELLVREENEVHGRSTHALVPTEQLLATAGAIFAHLLISDSTGIAIAPKTTAAAGFIDVVDLKDLSDASHVDDVLRTRLFRSEVEDQFIPVHRVVAEFLAGLWLGKRVDGGLSERRLFQAIHFNWGVPSALRGLHAWLGYFCPKVTKRCIDADPYGFLRYGETSNLPAQDARHLLVALSKLADEDPYFRSEDWGVRSVAGLARSELKGEVIAVIRGSERHTQLSALILQSLSGSPLINDIVPELLAVLADGSSAYVERYHAAKALVRGDAPVDWAIQLDLLLSRSQPDSSRLAVEILALLPSRHHRPSRIADALVACLGIDDSERRERYSSGGSDHLLIDRLSPSVGQTVLDAIAARISWVPRSRHWTPNRYLTSAIFRLIAKSLKGPTVAPQRFWSWVRFAGSRYGDRDEAARKVRDYLQQNSGFRRRVQRIVLDDETVEGGPWMAIVHELPSASAGLALSLDDVEFFLNEICQADLLSERQITLWADLLLASGKARKPDEPLKRLILESISRHTRLAAAYNDITRRPERDWAREEEEREQRYAAEKLARFERHRISFAKMAIDIANGKALTALTSLAAAYLGHYSDLDSAASPHERLKEWVGDEITGAALAGFIAALSRSDLPDLEKVCSARIEGKHWTVEPVILCGIAELVRQGRSLNEVDAIVVRSALGVWWDMPELNSTELGDEIERQLENCVFQSDESAEKFVTTIIEPQLVAGRDHVFGLYRFAREPRFRSFSPSLAAGWLQRFPKAKRQAQEELVRLVLHHDEPSKLITLIDERLSATVDLESDVISLWEAAAFCLAPGTFERNVGSPQNADKMLLWSIKELVKPDRTEIRPLSLDINRLEAIVQVFAPKWPAVSHPIGTWSGDRNPWDASEFIISCINAIGANTGPKGSEALERLSAALSDTTYAGQIKHVRVVQRRNRRDKEYIPPPFSDLKRTLKSAEPGGIDDLKALFLDKLADVQRYVRDADTGGWEVFWDGDKPKIENICRDRLLDLLRPRIVESVALFPELPMPDSNRVDIFVSFMGYGLPVEIKGQWHPEVWEASKTQLTEKYARDWRTSGRGIYLVFWFGATSGKRLTVHPDGRTPPTTPLELEEMLADRLGVGERSRIDIVVFDAAMPPKQVAAKRKKRGIMS